MATAALPSTLHAKLTALARRMAALRLMRAAAGVALVLAVTSGIALLADHWLRLPGFVRFVLLGGWVALAVSGLVRCVRSLGKQADVDALAALIEQEYPNLAERLTTSVELSEARESAHGSPALIDLLLRETEIRASRLNFLQAAPEEPTFRRAGLAALAVVALLAPAAVWPHSYLAQLRRLALPWATAPVGFEIVANPGDAFVARGHALDLSAHLRPDGADTLPSSATLVMTDANGKTVRLAMKSNQSQVFHCYFNAVAEDFHYHVEAGDAAGAEYQVTAVDPVQLAGDSPSITITPPAYALKSVEVKTITGLGDFSALQYGQLAFAYRFNRPAVRAYLDWTAQDNSEKGAHAMRHDLTLAGDGISARIELPVQNSGRLTLTLEGEHEILTVLPPQSLNVITDKAPAFVKVTGVTEQVRAVSTFDTVPLELTLADDYGLATLDLEYRVNDGPIRTEKVTIDGMGTPQAAGRYGLKLTGKVKAGDTFHYRFRLADNRRLPEAKIGPNVVFLPSEGRWFTFKVASQAEPLKQQEIAAQRDDIRKRLESLIEELRGEQRRIYKTQAEARQSQKMPAEAGFMLQDLRKEHQGNERTLADLARDAGMTPELKPLANRLQDVSDQEMRNASAALQQADKEKSASAPRDQQFRKADRDVGDAIKKLEGLKAENDQIAQQRLDQMKLEQLAERQQQLAEQAAQETDPRKAKELAQEQQKLADELKRLTEESAPLRQAVDAAQAEKSKELAEKARELAQQQRDLAQAMNQTNKDAIKEKLADLAKKQRELADEAAKLAKNTERPTKAAQTRQLDAEKPKEAAEALEKGDPNGALTKQEQTAQDLERLANELDGAINLAKDPREAAKQLARLQDDLKNRTAHENRKTPLAKMPPERIDDLRNDQQAIKRAVERLSVPPANADARREKLQAEQHAEKAAEKLATKDAKTAETEMAEAKKSLDRLVERLPSLKQRQDAAREEIARLRQQQSEVARQAEQLAKQAEPNPVNADQARRDLAQKLAESARKQADTAERLGKLDLPNLEARQERTRAAMDRALQDLQSARPQDVPASQADAKRQLERLEQALNNQKPADEKAAELASKQRKLSEHAAALNHGDKPAAEKVAELQKIQNQQAQIARETAALPATEAPQRQAEATEATKHAEQTARQSPADAAARMDDAAKALAKLADQLNGESDASKADRLAKKQAELARESADKEDHAAKDELRKKQQQVQEEAKQLRGGDDAAKEKQKADDALAHLSRTPPEKMADAQQKAADALKDLAEKLNGLNDAAKAAELAKEQRQIADEAGKQPAGDPKDTNAAKQQAQQAAHKQADLARQMQRFNPAKQQQMAKRAAQQMQAAQKALEQAKDPAQAREELGKAADAAEQLAKELGRRQDQQAGNNPMGQPNSTGKSQPTPAQLAEQQKQLARQTQQARQDAARQNPQQVRQATQQLAQNQKELSQQTGQLQSSQPKALQQAREAMNQAEQSLARGDWEKAQQKQQDAARTLEEMARHQPQQAAKAAGTPPPDQQQASNLPNQAQSERARQLAARQKELRDAVQKAQGQQQAQNQPPANNPAADLAKEQQAIADAAKQMAQQQAQQNGQQSAQAQQAQQAAKATQQASNHVQSGALPQAKQSGHQAAQQMQQLAQAAKGDAGQAAQKLAQRQEIVNRQLEQLADNAEAQKAQQQAQQGNLQKQAEQLGQQMQQQAQQMRGSPAKQAMQQASQATQQANQAMQQAQRGQQQGNTPAAQQSQQQAAQNLDRAAQLAQQASQMQAQQANPQGQSQQGSPQQQAGQSLQQAQSQMGQAQQRLGQGQPQQAQDSMQQAAQSMQQAAQQMSQQGQPGKPSKPSQTGNNDGANGNAALDLAKYGKDAKKFQGKPWGDLPGELRTRIIQDLKAQYGDDYGRMIKMYFEQLADKKGPPVR